MYTSLISAAQLAALINTDSVQSLLIFDTNHDLSNPEEGRRQWEAYHIPGSTYLHLEEDLSGAIISGKTGRHPLLGRADFLTAVEARGFKNGSGQQVVIYDSKGGGIAARAWWMFKWIGHEKVAVLDGGLPAWKNWQEKQTDDTSITPQNTASTLATKSELEPVRPVTVEYSDLQKRNQLLIDSRTAPRYRGEHEPIDPVAGHIKGAINLPWPDNLGEDGRFKSVEALKNRFAPLRNKAVENVFYCGSGVTACHNLLAYYHVFGELPGLYAGSWSEYIVR